jgi:hypothetical protein
MSDASNYKSDVMHAKGCHSNLNLELSVTLDEALERDLTRLILPLPYMEICLPYIEIWRVVTWHTFK